MTAPVASPPYGALENQRNSRIPRALTSSPWFTNSLGASYRISPSISDASIPASFSADTTACKASSQALKEDRRENSLCPMPTMADFLYIGLLDKVARYALRVAR